MHTTLQIKSILGLMIGVITMSVFISACGQKVISHKAPREYVRGELDKLAPVEMKADLSRLSENDQKAVARLMEAARIIDELFLIQVSPSNPQIRSELQKSPANEDYLSLFNIMFGSWNRMEHEKPFINKKAKPAGAGYYPEDMTKSEFETFLQENPELAAKFQNEFTVIRRREGKLVAVPYHEEYADKVRMISKLLDEAAKLTDDTSLKTFLQLRARDFLTDDFFESDMAWMDLTGDLEIVIGPYEVYEDQLYGYKAAYEAFICVVDHAESQKLEKTVAYLNEMEKNLPIDDKYKNFNRGTSSPIKVVQEIFSAGDTKAGIQTTAFNLPNDERVREAKGSKKVMLKNVAQAKYEKCWIPIVNTILAEEPLQNVSFEAYFNHVLLHEISHGLGPGIITLENGTQTTVSRELKELYPLIEECKADILGMYNLLFLIDKGVFPETMRNSAFASYLGGMFRSIRFGINEAHGGGVAAQFNYMIEKGAFIADSADKLSLDEARLEAAIRDLSRDVLIIEALGDYSAAEAFAQKYAVMTPLMERIVNSLIHVPIDIKPIFPI